MLFRQGLSQLVQSRKLLQAIVTLGEFVHVATLSIVRFCLGPSLAILIVVSDGIVTLFQESIVCCGDSFRQVQHTEVITQTATQLDCQVPTIRVQVVLFRSFKLVKVGCNLCSLYCLVLEDELLCTLPLILIQIYLNALQALGETNRVKVGTLNKALLGRDKVERRESRLPHQAP